MARLVLLLACVIGIPSFSEHEDSKLQPRLRAQASRPDSALQCREQLQRYLDGAFRGLEAMRGKDGLLRDTVRVVPGKPGPKVVDYKNEVAPTDMALDVLVQIGLLDFPKYQQKAAENLNRILASLKRWPTDEKTGLFYRLYEEGEPRVRDLSSVDNIHLYLALWTLARTKHPSLDPSLRNAVQEAFDRMDFSSFFDEETNRVGGNLKAKPDGSFELEPYRYDFGSEARSVLILGWALQGFKGVSDAKVRKALKETPIPVSPEGELLFWDGGLFQALLPTLLIDEGRYGASYRRNQASVLGLVNGSTRKVRHQSETETDSPLAPTASLVDATETALIYSGKVGFAGLKNSSNEDAVRETIVVPHGALLASLSNPCAVLRAMEQMEKASNGPIRFFEPTLGWMASASIVSEPTVDRITPIPGLVGVDKGIESLVLIKLTSPRGQPSARALRQDPAVHRRLQMAYGIIESRLNRARQE